MLQCEDKCQHYILTFEYPNKLAKRPSTIHLPGITDTHKLHQIGNTKGKHLYYRKFACCCFGCIHGSEDCSNDICPDDWSACDLAKKKSVKPDLKYWFGDDTCNLPDICNLPHIEEPCMQQLSWPAILRALAQQGSFFQLQRYIAANPIPQLAIAADDTFRQSDTNLLDLVALHHMPEDTDVVFAPYRLKVMELFPSHNKLLTVKGRGYVYRNKGPIIYEAVLNMGQYLDDNYVSNGVHNFYDRGTLPEQYAQYSDNFNPHVAFNMLQLYKREVVDICSDGAFMGIWQM